jgi:glycosyltransferase involved in cell wall biosynthesis
MSRGEKSDLPWVAALKQLPGDQSPPESRRQMVLFLIPSLHGGGAERVITTLLQYLDKTRFELVLAVIDMRNAVYQSDLPADVELVDLDASRVRYALPKIFRLIRARRPDVVFSTLGHLNLALAVMRPILPNGPRYIARETCVVSEIINDYPFGQIWRWAYRIFYWKFDCVVCQSHDMRDDLVQNFAIPAARAIVVHNPVDIRRVRQQSTASVGLERRHQALVGEPRDQYSLVSAGRMVRQKGFDLAIEALALCADTRVTLTLLGDGPLRSELEVLARRLGVSSRVRFVGFQRNPYPYLAHAGAYLLSSRYEGFPNVVLEALACGTPVIAVPAPGGVNEILDNMEHSIIAAAIDSHALGEAITKWASNTGRLRESSSAVDRYAVENIVQEYERLLGPST